MYFFHCWCDFSTLNGVVGFEARFTNIDIKEISTYVPSFLHSIVYSLKYVSWHQAVFAR
jgi:hypothetical protein